MPDLGPSERVALFRVARRSGAEGSSALAELRVAAEAASAPAPPLPVSGVGRVRQSGLPFRPSPPLPAAKSNHWEHGTNIVR